MRFLRRRQGRLVRWALSALMDVSTLIPLPILMLLVVVPSGLAPGGVPGYGPLLLAYAAAGMVETASRAKSDRDAAGYRVGGALAGTAVAYLWSYFVLPDSLTPGGLFSFNPAVSVIPFAWIAWAWGSETVAKGVGYYAVYDRFRTRVLMLVASVAVLLIVLRHSAGAVSLLLWWNVILFFISSLTLLFLSRQEMVRSEQQRIGEETTAGQQPGAVWVVAGLLALSLGAAHLLSVQALAGLGGQVIDRLQPLINWLWDVFMLLIYPYLYLVFLGFSYLLRFRRPPQPQEEQPVVLPDEGPPGIEVTELPGEAGDPGWGRWLLFGLFAAAMIWWLLSLRRIRAAQEAGDGDEIRESLGFWSQLCSDLSALWAHLRGRISVASSDGQPLVETDREINPRTVFRRLQRWGRSHGRGRRLAETPEQYRQALAERFPSGMQHIALIADLYNRARYGPHEPPQTDVEAGFKAVTTLEQEKM